MHSGSPHDAVSICLVIPDITAGQENLCFAGIGPCMLYPLCGNVIDLPDNLLAKTQNYVVVVELLPVNYRIAWKQGFIICNQEFIIYDCLSKNPTCSHTN